MNRTEFGNKRVATTDARTYVAVAGDPEGKSTIDRRSPSFTYTLAAIVHVVVPAPAIVHPNVVVALFMRSPTKRDVPAPGAAEIDTSIFFKYMAFETVCASASVVVPTLFVVSGKYVGRVAESIATVV